MNPRELLAWAQQKVDDLGDQLATEQDALALARGWTVTRTPWGGRVYRDRRFDALKAAYPGDERHADTAQVSQPGAAAGLPSVTQPNVIDRPRAAAKTQTAHPGVVAGWAVDRVSSAYREYVLPSPGWQDPPVRGVSCKEGQPWR